MNFNDLKIKPLHWSMFTFDAVIDEKHNKWITKVNREDPYTKVIKSMNIDIMPIDIINWTESGENIQDRLWKLSATEREFLSSGLLPDEQNEIFNDYIQCEECGKWHKTESDAKHCCESRTRDCICPVCKDTHFLPSQAEECCQDLFIETPLLRGFTEIKEIYELIHPLGGMIIGGYARYACSPNKQPIKADDLDIYCSTMEVFEDVKKVLKNTHNTRVQFESRNAISYTMTNSWSHCPTIQLVKPINEGKKIVSGSLEEIMMNFDFTITRAYIKDENTCIVDKRFIKDEEDMFLRIKNIHCPISSTFRFMKYRNKGYSTGAREIMKLFYDWDARDKEYKDNLAHYFDIKDPTQSEIDTLEELLNID